MTEELLLKMLQDGLSINLERNTLRDCEEIIVKISYKGQEVCQDTLWY